ncbi:uncharacterized protein LOC128226164 [Mya arenaria]|uniref:uncharacterized protein LOC128226164 n=1 Tax=Mya arenaria TaxID=6604 RepID=UPI0022E5D5CF|nr:uncharacterized protein LOC128226164 [Mya arenaria]
MTTVHLYKGRFCRQKQTKKNKSHLNAAQVRDFIVCQECRKRRVVYCSHKMSAAQKTQLARLQDLEVYTCGSSLFPSFHPLHGEVFVREALVCNMEIETSYYSAVTKKFQKICFFCGDTDILGAEDEPILSLLKQYSIVRPICRGCLEQGKKPATRNSLKLKKTTDKHSTHDDGN